MTLTGETGAVVDTMVISWLLDERPNGPADRYRELLTGRPVILAFQTVMELRYGALRAGWGELRRRRLERRIAELSVVQPDDETISCRASLPLTCRQVGHPLADKIHDGDRWTAATALRLRLPIASHDRIFSGVPGLALLTLAEQKRRSRSGTCGRMTRCVLSSPAARAPESMTGHPSRPTSHTRHDTPDTNPPITLRGIAPRPCSSWPAATSAARPGAPREQ